MWMWGGKKGMRASVFVSVTVSLISRCIACIFSFPVVKGNCLTFPYQHKPPELRIEYVLDFEADTNRADSNCVEGGETWNWIYTFNGHIFKHFHSQTRIFNKAVVGLVGISNKSFMILVTV